MKNLLSFYAFVISIFIFGCSSNIASNPASTPSPEQMDKSPFTGIPCAAPCWYGLEVGESSEGDVMAVLPTLAFIHQDSIQVIRRDSITNLDYKTFSPGVEIRASCVNPFRECLTLTIANDALTKIVLGLNYEIMADEAIGYLGNPDYLGVAPIGSEYFVCEVYMVWSHSGLALTSTFEARNNIKDIEKYCDIVYQTGKLPSSLLIQEAKYLSDAELRAIMSPESSNTFFEFTGTAPDN